MKLLHVVPIASLALVSAVVVAAAFYDPPIDFPFTEPPEGAPVPKPSLVIGEHTLHGVVRSGAGDPVDGAGVSIYQSGRPYFAWTDADGAFRIDELGPGAGRVLVSGLGYQSSGFDVPAIEGTTASEPAQLVLDRPIEPPPTLTRLALEDLAGLVQFGPHATPEQGYELLFLPTTAPNDPAGGFPRRVPVDASGVFEVDLLHEGEYRIILLAPEDRGGRSPDLLGDGEGGGRIFVFEAGDELPALELRSTAGAVVGRVTGPPATSPDGLPGARTTLRGALVRAERVLPGGEQERGDAPAPVERSTFRATRTDPDGRYVLRDLAPGRYRVSVVAGLRRQEQIVVVPANQKVDLDFTSE